MPLLVDLVRRARPRRQGEFSINEAGEIHCPSDHLKDPQIKRRMPPITKRSASDIDSLKMHDSCQMMKDNGNGAASRLTDGVAAIE